MQYAADYTGGAVTARRIAIAGLATFIVIAVLSLSGLLAAADMAGIRMLEGQQSPLLTDVMLVGSFLGNGELQIPLALLFALLLRRREGMRTAGLYMAACLVGWGLNVLLKLMLRQQRPRITTIMTDAGGFGFPSGHAMLGPVVYGLAAALFAMSIARPLPRAVLLGGATAACLWIALARVYLGAHWPSDVAAGLAGGTMWAALSFSRITRPNPAEASVRD